MATGAQVAANRRNAEKSTGPRTAQGKVAVSQNAVKHGLLARHDVIRGEDREEFDLYREEMFWELNPVGTMESRLAERIVSLAWRLRRAERIQNEAFDALLAKDMSSPLARLTQSLRARGADQPPDDAEGCDGDPALGRAVVRDFSGARVLDRLLMYERRIESSLYRTMAELQKLRRAQELEPAGAAQVSKASRLRIAGGTPATRPPADREFMTDSVKQSQSSVVNGGHSPPDETEVGASNEVSSADQALQTSNVTLDSPREPPESVAPSEGDCTKQSQCGGANTMSLASPEKDEETPEGVTPSGEGPACRTEPIVGPVENKAERTVGRDGPEEETGPCLHYSHPSVCTAHPALSRWI